MSVTPFHCIAVVTNPMDVVKTRLQVLAHITSHSPQLGASQQESAPASRSSYKIWPTARQLVREEGSYLLLLFQCLSNLLTS